MTTFCALKVAVQPASQSFPMEMSECFKSGSTWACMLAGSGKGKVPVWVERIVLPLGIDTVMLLVVVVRFCSG